MPQQRWISKKPGGVPNWLWIYFYCGILAVLITVLVDIVDNDELQPIDPIPVVTVTVTVTETVGWR